VTQMDKASRLRFVGSRTMYAVYLVLFILTLIPILSPLGIPIPVGKYTKASYDYVQNLPRDSVVLVSGEFDVGLWPEEETFARPMLIHLFRKGLKIVIVHFSPDSPVLIKGLVDVIDPQGQFGMKYGEDYVMLGYYAGREAAMAAFLKDVHSLVKADYYGTSIGQLPLMQRVKSSKDIALVIDAGGTDPGIPVRQFQSTFNLPLIEALTIGWVPTIMPYLSAGQLVGMVGGIRGGAEYELLIGKPGAGLTITDALSLNFLFLVFLIVVSNAVQYLKKKEGKEK